MTQKPTVSFRLKKSPKRQAVGSNPAKCAICSVENPMNEGFSALFHFPRAAAAGAGGVLRGCHLLFAPRRRMQTRRIFC